MRRLMFLRLIGTGPRPAIPSAATIEERIAASRSVPA